MTVRSARAAVLAVAAVGCGRDARPQVDREAARGVFEEIAIDAPPGLSGLAVDDRGVLWAVPERDRFLVEIVLGEHTAKTTLYPLYDVPTGLDTEGLAFLGDGRFAIATEGHELATASVLYVERRGDRFAVTRERALSSRELGVELTPNHGAEGACGRGDDVVVAIEPTGRLADGARWAPIARLRGSRLAVSRLRLTSETGKLSALDCTIAADGSARAWAIERHHGTSRILRFAVGAAASEITPTVELDLGPILRGALDLEGVVELPDGRLVAVNDN